MSNPPNIENMPGYTYGKPEVPTSPVTVEDFRLMCEAVPFTEKDQDLLRLAGTILRNQTVEVLDAVVVLVGDKLEEYWAKPDGCPNPDYVAALQPRSLQWIIDTCDRPYDQDWLNYQHEIGLRHHRLKKNKTDGIPSVPHVPLRYLLPFVWSNSYPLRPILASGGHSAETVDGMLQAWTKSLLLQVTLWAHPYTIAGDW